MIYLRLSLVPPQVQYVVLGRVHPHPLVKMNTLCSLMQQTPDVHFQDATSTSSWMCRKRSHTYASLGNPSVKERLSQHMLTLTTRNMAMCGAALKAGHVIRYTCAIE